MNQIPKSIIVIYGVNWCSDCTRVQKYLREHQIPFEFVNIDYDKSGEQLVLKHNHGFRSVPTIIFPDGSSSVEPSIFELAKKLNIN